MHWFASGVSKVASAKEGEMRGQIGRPQAVVGLPPLLHLSPCALLRSEAKNKEQRRQRKEKERKGGGAVDRPVAWSAGPLVLASLHLCVARVLAKLKRRKGKRKEREKGGKKE